MDNNDEERKPLYIRKYSAEKICNEFLIDLRINNKNNTYNSYVYEDDRISNCTIDFHDDKLEEQLTKKGLTKTEKLYGTKGSLELTLSKSMPEEGYWSQAVVPLILSGHPDTYLDSLKKIGDIIADKYCTIIALHTYKETTPIVQVRIGCKNFNRTNDVIKYINEISNTNRISAKMKKTEHDNPYMAR